MLILKIKIKIIFIIIILQINKIIIKLIQRFLLNIDKLKYSLKLLHILIFQ